MGIKKVEKQQQKCKIMKKNGFLMPPHTLNNFEVQEYYPDEPTSLGVYSRDNLAKRSFTDCNSVEIKDDAYIKKS